MLKQTAGKTETALVRPWVSTAIVLTAALLGAPAALADSSNSANWAGYAVHRAGIALRKVSASWKQPSVTCTPGQEAFSAYWVGLGGFSQTASALEQIGTETDCNVAGHAVYNVWYELVPAPSTPIRLTVGAGDTISASVSVSGHQVTASLYDSTRHRGFTRTFHASVVDVSSAEWIVEAPSDCSSGLDVCRTLPLADFGTAAFSSARAVGSKGHAGSISSARWDTTKITLTPGGRRYVAYQGAGPTGGAASPSALEFGGTAFTVSFSRAAGPANPFMTARASATTLSGQLYH